MAQTAELTAEMERAGAWVFVAGLRPASSATVVRAAGGEVSMLRPIPSGRRRR
jgi:hypothetical protein